MYEVLLFSLFLAALAALIIYSIETAKPVTNLSWSLTLDQVKNIRLSWQLPANVDKLTLRLKLNGDLVTATLPVDATSWDFPADAGAKIDAEVVSTFEGKDAKSAPLSFVVPKASATVQPVTGLSWEVLDESDDSNESLFDGGVDLDKDGNVDYYLATKKQRNRFPDDDLDEVTRRELYDTEVQKPKPAAVDVKIPEMDFKSLDADLKRMVSEKVAEAMAKLFPPARKS